MSVQTIEINNVKIIFDKEKTENYRTDFNQPCDCQDCRNFYRNVENNSSLIKFLSDFGIDYHCTEEVFSWDLGNESNSQIHSKGYYGVFGQIDGEEFDFEKFGVKITIAKGASVPCNRTGEYFWISVEGDFPYILDEKRELTVLPSKESFFEKLKAIFKKIFDF